MEKEMIKNRQATELALIKAVDDIIEESGFEGLGINAVAAKAGVAKMLIYRYFNSLDGLIAAYIQQNDYWINFDEELPVIPSTSGDFFVGRYKPSSDSTPL
jgi:AcrR family transcriptional regulator